MVLNVLNNDGDPSEVNKTLIVLISKVKRPTHSSEFKTISLCNMIFKLITKTLANRLKVVLPSVVNENQSAFIPNRLIIDNVLVAF